TLLSIPSPNRTEMQSLPAPLCRQIQFGGCRGRGMDASQPTNLLHQRLAENGIWSLRKPFQHCRGVETPSVPTLEVQDTRAGVRGAPRLQQVGREVDQKQRQP